MMRRCLAWLARRPELVVCVLAACSTSPAEPGGNQLAMQADRLALTSEQSCMIERSGEVVCWGIAAPVRVTPGDRSLRFVALRGGAGHVCGLTADSTAYCWGHNLYGEVGDGMRVRRDRPARVATDRRFIAINASVQTSCALDATGRGYCWGRNDWGAIGNGAAAEGTFELEPTPVASANRFRSLVGATVNCGLRVDGRAYCWGHVPGSFNDMYIAPGDCTTAYYLWYAGRQCLVPTPIATELRFASLAGSSCGLTSLGEAYCWGDGYYGTFGDGRAGVYSVFPVRVNGEIRFRRLTSGSTHVCGVDLGGTAYCWGNNFAGQLGIGEQGRTGGAGIRTEPTRVLTSLQFVDIVAGASSTCALTAAEDVWCWGRGSQGVPLRVNIPAQ